MPRVIVWEGLVRPFPPSRPLPPHLAVRASPLQLPRTWRLPWLSNRALVQLCRPCRRVGRRQVSRQENWHRWCRRRVRGKVFTGTVYLKLKQNLRKIAGRWVSLGKAPTRATPLAPPIFPTGRVCTKSANRVSGKTSSYLRVEITATTTESAKVSIPQTQTNRAHTRDMNRPVRWRPTKRAITTVPPMPAKHTKPSGGTYFRVRGTTSVKPDRRVACSTTSRFTNKAATTGHGVARLANHRS
jgi:hypothetical protein